MIWTKKLANMGLNLGLFGRNFLRYLRKTVKLPQNAAKIFGTVLGKKT